ncbi:uncharacterized protein LOC128557996 [Mercenaria mercenaria]|uniref:uncharacterized protein LOC128557996 n=1 Tax=Mercenaria mercenaria TaxID=6596 RepID=UPI00234EAF1F|nr:uncharacterized protein LOC128557996 [Mercenaria mercenaria]
MKEKENLSTIPRDAVKAVIQSALTDGALSDSLSMPDDVTSNEQSDSIPDDLLYSYSLSSKDWKKAQKQDQVISTIIDHLNNGTKPAKPDGPMHTYTRDWLKLILKDGVLFRKSLVNGYERLQLVLPTNLRIDIFEALHNDLGHQGRDRTTSLFKERFYFPGLDTFVAEQVRNCGRCIRRKSLSSKAELVPILSSAPMQVVCLDFLSLERSKGGFEDILVITDHFSRYAQAYPTRNQTARTTARFFLRISYCIMVSGVHP